MIDLIFWLDCLSPHVVPYVRRLSEMEAVNVTAVVQCEIPLSRAELGWSVPQTAGIRVVIARERERAERVFRRLSPESISVIGGLRNFPLGRFAMTELARRRARVGIVSETARSTGLKGFLRRMIYERDRRLFGSSIDFVLAISDLGMRWFRDCGYPESKLFDFGYCTVGEDTNTAGHSTGTEADVVELIYIGRCVDEKGVGKLLQALHICEQLPWKLTVLGDGPARQEWLRRATALGLGGRITFVGARPHQIAMEELASKDILVLPSTGKEGWGAVANEALMRGVPVLCSSNCGASELIGEPWRGEVAPSGDVCRWAATLASWIARGKRTPEERERILRWSECIAADAIATYFLDVIRHVYEHGPRPLPPWRRPVRNDKNEDNGNSGRLQQIPSATER